MMGLEPHTKYTSQNLMVLPVFMLIKKNHKVTKVQSC